MLLLLILLSMLLLDGLSTEYTNQLVPRDTQPEGPRGVPHILDYPWAAFEFDPQGRLRHAALSPLRIVERIPLSGVPISREQAVESALAWWLRDTGTAPRLPDEAREVRVLWALPMWMPNWANECLPDWCVRLEPFPGPSLLDLNEDLFTTLQFRYLDGELSLEGYVREMDSMGRMIEAEQGE